MNFLKIGFLFVFVLCLCFNVYSIGSVEFPEVGLTFSEKSGKVVVTEIKDNSTLKNTSLKVGSNVIKINNYNVENLNKLSKLKEHLIKKDEPFTVLFSYNGKIDNASGKVALEGGIIGFNFTFVMQIINFLILMILLQKFLYKPVLEILDKRNEEIKGNIEKAHEEREKAKELFENYKEKIEQINVEREKIITEAKVEGEKERKEIIDSAKKEAIFLVNDAKNIIKKETKESITAIRTQMADLVFEASKNIMNDIVDDNMEGKLREKVVEELKKTK